MKHIRILVFALITAFAITKNTKVYLTLGEAYAQSQTVSQVESSAVVAGAVATPNVQIAPISPVEQIVEPPSWLKEVIGFAMSIPTVGPIVVEILKWIGVLSALLTALSSLLLAVSKAFEAAGKVWTGAVKIKEYLDKAIYYVGYLSVFNVYKDKDNKTKVG